MWLFGRRKAAKPKGPKRRPSVSEGKPPVAERVHAFANEEVLRSSPSRRSSRRISRRRSSRSSISVRDVEKHSPNLDAAFIKEQGFPHLGGEDEITALPLSKRLAQSPHLRPVSGASQYGGIPYNFQVNPHSTLTATQRGRLQRPQPLRKPVNDAPFVRRKSTKKQKREHEHLREEEIRAMSMPLPQKRPAGNSGGMLRRDSKKVKGPLNHRLERPISDVSLPLEDSIHSSMSGSSDHRAFRVSALSMFSPRPTIRCSVGTQHYYSGTDTSPTSNKSKHSAHRSERRTATSNEVVDDKRTSRIDDLADTFDAGDIREILERDKRRRDKKRRADDERLRRRLERRAEKQRVMEVGGTPSTPRREARGAVGLGIEKVTATPMEDVRPSTPQRPQVQTPVPTPKVKDVTQVATPIESPMEEPVVSDAQQAIRYSRGSVSGPNHARGASNVSHLPELLSKRIEETPMDSAEHTFDPMNSDSLHAVETTDTSPKKSSDRRRSSEGRRMSYFASFFRRGKSRSQDQGRTTPSEISFSNTSRESMSRQPLPAHLVAPTPTPPIPIKRPSGAPRRTMSKFREDLPEFPISPPDSRMQSPEISTVAVFAGMRRAQQPADLHESNSSGARTDSPVSPGLQNAGLMSQSLASVDSEGSWLSGKPIQRASNKSHLRSSVGSASALKRTEEFNASYEELGIPDDEYFARLTPRPDEGRRSSEVLAQKVESDDEEAPPATVRPPEEDELVQSSVGRKPTVVHRQPRVKSTEGLLSFFQQAPEESAIISTVESTGGDSPASEGEPMIVQRAKSVDLGMHHVRQLSAGSARLLDIAKRTSNSSQSKPQ